MDLFKLILPLYQTFLDQRINRSQAKNLKAPPKVLFKVGKTQILLNDVYHRVKIKKKPQNTSCLI